MDKYSYVPHLVRDLMQITTEAKKKQTAFLSFKGITISDARGFSQAELSSLNQEYANFSA